MKTLSDGPHELEVEWHAAASGSLLLWIDGIEQARLTGLDSDTMQIESIRLGAPYVSTFASESGGSFYIDDYIAWNPAATPVAQYVYDGDSNRVKSVEGGVTTAYVGSHFEWKGSTSTMVKYYYAGSQRIAMRTGTGAGTAGLIFLLGDHLGSTSVSYDATSGQNVKQWYKPWGEIRASSGTLPTDYTFTGQKSDSYINMLWYNSRWYDSYLNQWTQPDPIIPDPYNPLDFNRYLYVRANPLRYIDPSGYTLCDADSPCTDSEPVSYHYHVPEQIELLHWKALVLERYGITLSDTGDKPWNLVNVKLIYSSLEAYDMMMGGQFKAFVGGGIWTRMNYTGLKDYSGFTVGTNVQYFTKGSNAIWQMNIFHETGHVVNSMPGMDNVFSNELEALVNPSFIDDNGKIHKDTLITQDVKDPNHGTAKAVQASLGTDLEAIADIFANYAAGNINQGVPIGRDMYNFATGLLAKWIWHISPGLHTYR